jgi:hypothetical protein
MILSWRMKIGYQSVASLELIRECLALNEIVKSWNRIVISTN